MLPGRVVEQAQADLQADHAAGGVIDALHRDAAVLHQADDDVAALGIVRVHDHVDAGVDAHGHGLGLVGRHVVAGEEVVDVGPVGHQHAVPVQLLLHPAGEEGLVGVGGDAVDGGGIDHRGQRAGLEALLERTEVFLAEVVLGDVGRGAVLAGVRHAVAHEMLDAHGHVLQADVVRVGTLQGDRLHAGHLGLQVRILAPALPLARPARVTAEVHHRGEHPRALRGAGLVGHRVAHHLRVIAVEGGSKVDFLREEGAVGQVGGAVDHVQAVDARDADVLHRALLDLGDVVGRLHAVEGMALEHVQDGADLVLAEKDVHLRRVHVVAGVVRDVVDGDLDHLAHLLLQGHPLEDLFDFGLHGGIGLDGGEDGGGLASARESGRGGEGEGRGLQQVLAEIHRILVSVFSNSQR